MATSIVTQIKNYIIRLLTRKVANEIIKSAGGKPSGTRGRSSSRSRSNTSSRGRTSAGSNRRSLTEEQEGRED
ncbi:MAG: hypothetical protein IJ523_09085 [Succinivibrionaceae bacterium]|nr:hypothetical protein [Succinivibrionaceae bacterium]